MPDIRYSLLSTRLLPEESVLAALTAGIRVDFIPFIHTEPVIAPSVAEKISELFRVYATVIFTSMNAVEAVSGGKVWETAGWKIGCMGNTTRQLIEKFFPSAEIIATGGSAAELASQVIKITTDPRIYFFCGNQRRDELPGLLLANGFDLKEICVYHSHHTPHKLNYAYDGILFYSPSAVQSYFSVNFPGRTTCMFAIGETTAAAIRRHCDNKLVTGRFPGRDQLLQEAIAYFS